MRKLLKWLAVAVLLAAVSCCVAAAADTVAGGNCGAGGSSNVSWMPDDSGTLTVTGSGEMQDYTSQDHAPWYERRMPSQK